MALAHDVKQLADRSLAALDSSHDYFTFTRSVWRLVGRYVNAGEKFRFRNIATGTKVSEQSLLSRWEIYDVDYHKSSTFQHFVSLFEEFIFDLLRLWLAAYPGSLSKKQLDFGTVLKAPDKSTIVMTVVDKELNELKYERVADWFAYFERLAKLGCPTGGEIAKLTEIKASRDILVHNKGIVNATYLDKSGSLARFKECETLELPAPYHRESWETIKKVVGDLADAVLKKTQPHS